MRLPLIKSKLSKKWLVAGLLLAVAVGVFLILEVTNKTHIFNEEKAKSGVITSTDESQPTEPEDKTSGPSASQDSNASTPPSPPGGQAPVAPYGNFVSNHNPNLDGNPAPSSIQSVCNTTPGAQCLIEFTNPDGVVKTLSAQTTDNNGSAIWNWDVKQAGFSAGSWKIKAIATLNGQTVTIDDALTLEVEP